MLSAKPESVSVDSDPSTQRDLPFALLLILTGRKAQLTPAFIEGSALEIGPITLAMEVCNSSKQIVYNACFLEKQWFLFTPPDIVLSVISWRVYHSWQPAPKISSSQVPFKRQCLVLAMVFPWN